MTHRNTAAHRLTAAGYVHVSGWVPASYAARVEAQIEAHREDVEKIAGTKPPRGRPKKETA